MKLLQTILHALAGKRSGPSELSVPVVRLWSSLLVLPVASVALAREAEPRVVIEKVIHSGEPAPGIPGFVIELPLQPQIDGVGNVLVYALINGPGVTAETDTAIWYGQPRAVFAGPPGDIWPVVRGGDAAPGVPGAHINLGQDYTGPGCYLSDTATLLVVGDLAGPGIDSTVQAALLESALRLAGARVGVEMAAVLEYLV